MNETERVGITSGGNWVVDRVKTVDHLPGHGMLGNIQSEHFSTGGGPANVLAALSRMGAPFPLAGVGIVGEDEDGRFVLDTFHKLDVDVANILTTEKAPTSYTDVMNEAGSGDRMFFHNRGANALFGPQHILVESLTCSIFHLGYLLLLDEMDKPDDEYGTVAARALQAIQEQGIKTSVDLVSEESDRFRTIVPPALRYVDYLIVNEIEAGRVAGRVVRAEDNSLDEAALIDAVEDLYASGEMLLVVVHMPEGVYIRRQDGKRISRGALALPEGFIKGAVGAGDAFCAGMLYGIHEGWDHGDSAHLGTCCAAASLSEAGATDGVRAIEAVLELGKRFPELEPPVKC